MRDAEVGLDARVDGQERDGGDRGQLAAPTRAEPGRAAAPVITAVADGDRSRRRRPVLPAPEDDDAVGPGPLDGALEDDHDRHRGQQAAEEHDQVPPPLVDDEHDDGRPADDRDRPHEQDAVERGAGTTTGRRCGGRPTFTTSSPSCTLTQLDVVGSSPMHDPDEGDDARSEQDAQRSSARSGGAAAAARPTVVDAGRPTDPASVDGASSPTPFQPPAQPSSEPRRTGHGQAGDDAAVRAAARRSSPPIRGCLERRRGVAGAGAERGSCCVTVRL